MSHPVRHSVLPLLALLGLTAGDASASYRIVRPIGFDASAAADLACSAPDSPACTAALDDLARQVATELAAAASHPGADLREVALLAADSGYPALRAAAATALASPFATAAETPVLAELADDPVPAVRAAALKALRSSNDPRAQGIARRADAYGSSTPVGEGGASESAPAAARMGVPLPSGAVYLFFASDPVAGRYAWHTTEPPERVLAALRGKGKGPLTPEEFRAQTKLASVGGESGGTPGMPSADDMQRAMAMAEQMMKAMEGAQGKSPEEQAAAMQRASHGVSSLDSNLAGAYEKEELFVGARLVIVPLAEGGEVVVAVYSDPVVGGTGITLHRAPLDAP